MAARPLLVAGVPHGGGVMFSSGGGRWRWRVPQLRPCRTTKPLGQTTLRQTEPLRL